MIKKKCILTMSDGAVITPFMQFVALASFFFLCVGGIYILSSPDESHSLTEEYVEVEYRTEEVDNLMKMVSPDSSQRDIDYVENQLRLHDIWAWRQIQTPGIKEFREHLSECVNVLQSYKNE